MFVGARAWFRGIQRANTKAAMNEALLAIALGQEPPVDPTTGQSFGWDPQTRTLTPSDGAQEIDPLVLP